MALGLEILINMKNLQFVKFLNNQVISVWLSLSDKIKERDFYKGLRDFGFGNLTSVDLLGETAGNLKKPDSYSGISKAFISHGYEISVTPIQMIMAYSALINGGNFITALYTEEKCKS